MNENKINNFKCFIYSITGFDRYRILLRQSMGKAVGYLILLSLLLSVAVFAPIYSTSNEVINKSTEYIVESMPDFSLIDGHLEVNGQMPIVIDDGNISVVVDTTPGAEDRILNQYDTVLLFTSDKMIMKDYVNRQEYPLSSFEGLNITKGSLIEAMPLIKSYIIVVLALVGIFMGLFFVAGKFISALVVSLIGLIANSSSKTNLSFKSLFKISIFSMTLPLIIGTVINALMINIPFLAVLFYVGSGIYVFGAIKSIKKELEISGGDSWNFYSSDTFNRNNNGNNNFDGFNYRNGDPNDNRRDYGYGSKPDFPPINSNNSKNNENGPENTDNDPTDASSGNPTDGPANGSAGNPANDEPQNNNSDEK